MFSLFSLYYVLLLQTQVKHPFQQGCWRPCYVEILALPVSWIIFRTHWAGSVLAWSESYLLDSSPSPPSVFPDTVHPQSYWMWCWNCGFLKVEVTLGTPLPIPYVETEAQAVCVGFVPVFCGFPGVPVVQDWRIFRPTSEWKPLGSAWWLLLSTHLLHHLRLPYSSSPSSKNIPSTGWSRFLCYDWSHLRPRSKSTSLLIG